MRYWWVNQNQTFRHEIEFGTAGTNWSQIGWRVGVRWQRLSNPIRPKDHISRLQSELSSKYAPLTPEGNGL